VSSDERDRLSGFAWMPGSDGTNGIIDVTFYRLCTTTLGIGEENASASGATHVEIAQWTHGFNRLLGRTKACYLLSIPRCPYYKRMNILEASEIRPLLSTRHIIVETGRFM
jgi:hypothetical protein